MLRKLVESLVKIGANCLPDVLAVLRDVNGDTGLQPVTTMADKGSDDSVAYYCDNMSIDRENASQMTWVTRHRAVWTEEVPGKAATWFLLCQI